CARWARRTWRAYGSWGGKRCEPNRCDRRQREDRVRAVANVVFGVDAGGDASIVVVADDDMADADGAAGQAGVAVPAVRVSGVRGGRSVRGGRGGRGGRTVRGAASAASPAGGDASIVVVADDDMADADGAAGQAGVAVPAVR
ncbi:hypothetical protein PR003_g34983, partial [Phytophthora rubi]